MKNIWIIILIIVAGGVIGFFVSSRDGEPSNDTTGTQSNARTMPEFALKDYNGTTVQSSDFRGKPLVVNSWAAWCPFCRKELPEFAKVQRELGDAIVIIAIDRSEPLATAKRYTDQLGVTDDMIFLLDPNDSFYASIGGFAMPETLLVDKEGIIREQVRGPIDALELRAKIQEHLLR